MCPIEEMMKEPVTLSKETAVSDAIKIMTNKK